MKKLISTVTVIVVMAMIVLGIVGRNKPTSFDLYDKYHHGTKTPPGWDVADWYKYKTETPIKAYDYLYWLAYGKKYNHERILQELRMPIAKNTPDQPNPWAAFTEDDTPSEDTETQDNPYALFMDDSEPQTNPFDGLFDEPEPQNEAFEKLKKRYYFGAGTPDRWSPSGWFSYKKEHPQKALDYLEGLAYK